MLEIGSGHLFTEAAHTFKAFEETATFCVLEDKGIYLFDLAIFFNIIDFWKEFVKFDDIFAGVLLIELLNEVGFLLGGV